MASFTRSFEITHPAGTEDISQGDNRIRNLKIDLEERLEDMFFGFNADDGTGDEATYGAKKLVFKEQASIATPSANQITIAAKESVDEKAELFWRDEDGDERQFTEGGQLLLGKHTTVTPVMHNTTDENGDGGRESRLTAKGQQAGGEISTLGYLEFSHDGTENDQKGKARLLLNDGDDDAAPGKIALELHADGTIEAYQDATNGSVCVKDENDMASDSDVHLATQQSIKKYVDDTHDSFARLYRNGDQAIATTNATKVELNAESYDSGTIGDPVTNNRITPVIAGYYLVCAAAEASAIADNGTFYCSIYKNGASVVRAINRYPGAGGQTSAISDIIYCNGTDYLELYALSNDSSYTVAGSSDRTFLSCVLIRKE